MYKYELKFNTPRPPSTYAGFYNERPFVISLSSTNLSLESHRINLFSQDSSSAPYQVPQNMWSHLVPQWKFVDADGDFIEYVIPELVETNPTHFIYEASAYYVDDLPGTVSLIATLETSGLSISSDNPEANLPGFSNSLVFDKIQHKVLATSVNHIKITQDGKNPIDWFKWTDTKIPFVVTLHPDSTSETINTNLYGLTGVDPIVFTDPKDIKRASLNLELSSVSQDDITWSDGKKVLFTDKDEYGFTSLGFYRGNFVSKASAVPTIISACYLHDKIVPEIDDWEYLNGDDDSWDVDGDWVVYKNRPQDYMVFKDYEVPAVEPFIVSFDYDVINFYSLGYGSKLLLCVVDKDDGSLKEVIDEIIFDDSGIKTYTKSLSSHYTGNFAFRVNSIYDGNFLDFPSSLIYKSIDYGLNINTVFAPQRNWNGVKSSDNGQYMYAFRSNSVFVSRDYGLTWEEQTKYTHDGVNDDFPTIESFMVSNDGKIIYLFSYGHIIRSLDYGNTFSRFFKLPAPCRKYHMLMSRSGKYHLFLSDGGACIYSSQYSDDYGETFINVPISHHFNKYTSGGLISDDGNIFLVYTGLNSSKYFYALSRDEGQTWEEIEAAYMTMSFDGKYMAKIVDLDLYYSSDYGNSFNKIYTFSNVWFGQDVQFKISDDGQFIVYEDDWESTSLRTRIFKIKDGSVIHQRIITGYRRQGDMSGGGDIISLYTRNNIHYNGFKFKDFYITQSEDICASSNKFQIKPFKRPYELRRYNESWESEEFIHSLALAEHTYMNPVLFDNFIKVSVGGVDSSYQSLGRTMYERIANFVKNHSDVDVCNLNQLYSHHKAIDNPIDDYRLNYPPEIRRLMDILSIKKTRLLPGLCKCDKNFVTELGNCIYCNHKHPLNRGTEAKTSDNYMVSANVPFVVENIYSVNDKTKFDIVYPTIDDLGGVEKAWLDELDSVSWLMSKDYHKYLIYEYIPTTCDFQVEGHINWDDEYTTLSPTVSSLSAWYGERGLLEELLNFEIHKGIYNG